jgi:hypothetical protein
MIRKGEGLNILPTKTDVISPLAARNQTNKNKKVNIHNKFYLELQQQRLTKLETMLPQIQTDIRQNSFKRSNILNAS